MNKIILLSTCLPLLTGCVIRPGNIVTVKSTVFGAVLGQDSTGRPAVKIGLVRESFQQIPTATNQVFAAPFTSHVQADITLLKQSATEDYDTKP